MTPKPPQHQIVLAPTSAIGPVGVSCTCLWAAGDMPEKQAAHDWYGRHLAVVRGRARPGYDQPGPDDLQFTQPRMRDDLTRRRAERDTSSR